MSVTISNIVHLYLSQTSSFMALQYIIKYNVILWKSLNFLGQNFLWVTEFN